MHVVEGQILFLHLFCLAVSSYWVIDTINIHRYQYPMSIDSCYFVAGGGGGSLRVCACVCFSFLDFSGVKLYISYVLSFIFNLFMMEVCFSTFCKIQFIDRL